jgi:hypothetical protein
MVYNAMTFNPHFVVNTDQMVLSLRGGADRQYDDIIHSLSFLLSSGKKK